LVLDFGGPVLVTPFELAEALGPESPAHRLLHGRGPLAPDDQPDDDWTELQEGRITEREYWDHRAAEWAELGGQRESVREMIAHLYDPPRPGMVRSGARELIHEAKEAGHPVGVLTNDLRAFHSEEWIEQMHVLDEIDVLVDGSIEGYLKPHPRLYELMSERLGVGFADMVFVDDQMTNVRGADALGITTVVFDPRDPAFAYAEARRRLAAEPARAAGSLRPAPGSPGTGLPVT
jgi:putative hydrolase of the HAD superfamily